MSSASRSNSLRERSTKVSATVTSRRPVSSGWARPGGLGRAGRGSPPPAEHGAHARNQLAEPEGLRHVIGGAELEPQDDVDLGVPGGHHDDRHRGERPHSLAQLDARLVGQHHVEQHEVGMDSVEQAEGLVAVPGHLDGRSPPSRARGERLAVRLLVVDDEHQRPAVVGGNRSGRRSVRCRGGRSASSSTCAGTARARAVRTHQAASSDGRGPRLAQGSRVVEADDGGGGAVPPSSPRAPGVGTPARRGRPGGPPAVGGRSARARPCSAALGPASGVHHRRM